MVDVSILLWFISQLITGGATYCTINPILTEAIAKNWGYNQLRGRCFGKARVDGGTEITACWANLKYLITRYPTIKALQGCNVAGKGTRN